MLLPGVEELLGITVEVEVEVDTVEDDGITGAAGDVAFSMGAVAGASASGPSAGS